MRKRQKHVSEEENHHTRSSLTLLDNLELMPIELFFEIFSRLSAKTIARCRCVSKLWSSILNHPDFADLFFKTYSARQHLLFTFEWNGKWFLFSSPQSQNPDENLSLLAADHRMCFPTRMGSCLFNGSVRGLLCTKYIWHKDRYNNLKGMVYNPSTGQTITLPKVRTRRADAMTYLGYDPINKQVKVLCMSLCGRHSKVEEHQVLTLGMKNPSWRKIECLLPLYPRSYGICIDGVLYYIADQNQRTPKPYTVVCFDVRSETFTYIDHALDNTINWSYTLINYTNKLGVLRLDDKGFFCKKTSSLELWVLDDVEKHKWLKKIYVLPPMWKNLVADTRLRIVGMTSNGELVFSPLVLSDPFYIFYYNVEKNSIVRVKIEGIGPVSGQAIYTFINHVEDVKRIEDVKYMNA